jgi:hypothetical protein
MNNSKLSSPMVKFGFKSGLVKLKSAMALPVAVAIALGTAYPAVSQVISLAPGDANITLSGTSGGSRADGSCAGNISATPNHTVAVAKDMNLRFTLQAEGGQPALLIRSASGQVFCVPGDSYSGGKVVIPGRWSQGNYTIFVGDRANGRHAYTLTISSN